MSPLISPRKFLNLLLFLTLNFAISAYSAELEDPDLKLSIAELRKKYPIDWLEKKYGNYIEGGCERDGDFEEEPKEKAICHFFYNKKSLKLFLEENRSSILIAKSATTEQILNSLSAKFLDVFNELSEEQIKSVIVHYNHYSSEVRVRDVINIMLNQISDLNFTHGNKNKIKSFFYSKQVAASSSLFCDNLRRLDDTNQYYDLFALNYLKRTYKYWGSRSIEGNIKNCITKAKSAEIKQKFFQQHQPQ